MLLETAINRRWCRRLLVLSLVLITIASVIPQGSAATLTVPIVSVDLDKIVHFLGFACLLLLAFAASKHLSFWQGVSVAAYVLIYGAAIEFVQYYIPYRTFNPVDIFANLCGVVFGVLIWIIVTAQSGKRMGPTCTGARKNEQKKALIPPHPPVAFGDPAQGPHFKKSKLGEQFPGAHELCLNTIFDHIPKWS